MRIFTYRETELLRLPGIHIGPARTGRGRTSGQFRQIVDHVNLFAELHHAGSENGVQLRKVRLAALCERF